MISKHYRARMAHMEGRREGGREGKEERRELAQTGGCTNVYAGRSMPPARTNLLRSCRNYADQSAIDEANKNDRASADPPLKPLPVE